MKMNWGTGIAITYVVFVLATVAVVLYTTTIDVNLVTDDYYEKELAFQDEIDKVSRTNALLEKPAINLAGKNVYIKFPNSINFALVEGVIKFYRPSDNNLDFSIPVSLNEQGEQIVNSIRLIEGMWRVYVDWNFNDSHFLSEQILMVR
jgi:hypothetical protein